MYRTLLTDSLTHRWLLCLNDILLKGACCLCLPSTQQYRFVYIPSEHARLITCWQMALYRQQFSIRPRTTKWLPVLAPRTRCEWLKKLNLYKSCHLSILLQSPYVEWYCAVSQHTRPRTRTLHISLPLYSGSGTYISTLLQTFMDLVLHTVYTVIHCQPHSYSQIFCFLWT